MRVKSIVREASHVCIVDGVGKSIVVLLRKTHDSLDIRNPPFFIHSVDVLVISSRLLFIPDLKTKGIGRIVESSFAVVHLRAVHQRRVECLRARARLFSSIVYTNLFRNIATVRLFSRLFCLGRDSVCCFLVKQRSIKASCNSFFLRVFVVVSRE